MSVVAIIHSYQVGVSRDFVNNNPGVPVFDWDDLASRDELMSVTGPLTVQGSPSVVVSYPSWFSPSIEYLGTSKYYDAGYEVIFQPSSWGVVEDRIKFLNSRTKGYLADVEVPDVEIIEWGDVPAPRNGQFCVFNGWDINGNKAIRLWRFEDLPPFEGPLKPPVVILGDAQ